MLKKIATITFCTLLATSHVHAWEDQEACLGKELQAKARIKPTGPPGPPGPQGPPGNLISNYGAAYGEPQNIFAKNSYLAVEFGHEQTYPVGVVHPVEGNLTRFEVTNSGIFHIGWSFTASSSVDDVVSIALFNISTLSSVQPSPLGIATVGRNTTQILSGQTIAAFPEGTVFEFQVCSQQGNTLITPKMTIIRIAQ